jgi:hypothetical protein
MDTYPSPDWNDTGEKIVETERAFAAKEARSIEGALQEEALD